MQFPCFSLRAIPQGGTAQEVSMRQKAALEHQYYPVWSFVLVFAILKCRSPGFRLISGMPKGANDTWGKVCKKPVAEDDSAHFSSAH
jgi:hypothetical protein